jgi:hypothetical protein
VRRSPLVVGATILTLGILSVTPRICANEASEVDTSSKATPDPFASDSRVSRANRRTWIRPDNCGLAATSLSTLEGQRDRNLTRKGQDQ